MPVELDRAAERVWTPSKHSRGVTRSRTRHTIIPAQQPNRDAKEAPIALMSHPSPDRLASTHGASPDQPHSTRSHLVNSTTSSQRSRCKQARIKFRSLSLSPARRIRRFTACSFSVGQHRCCAVGRPGGLSRRRAGPPPAPDRLSSQVGPGRSGAKAVGGHAPLQVPIWGTWGAHIAGFFTHSATGNAHGRRSPVRLRSRPAQTSPNRPPEIRIAQT